MIGGAHTILYSPDAEADRTFLRDVLDFPFVDAGHGWLIFALPPAELAVHPGEAPGGSEFFLMCDDIEAFVRRLTGIGVACSELTRERWGVISRITLPSGAVLGVYQPTHASPLNAQVTK